MRFTISSVFVQKSILISRKEMNGKKQILFELRKSLVYKVYIAKNPRFYYSAFFSPQFKNTFGNKSPKAVFQTTGKKLRAEFFLCP